MFDVEKEVPSLELCKRLKELGFPQNRSWIIWVKEKDLPECQGLCEILGENGEYILTFGWLIPENIEYIKAPTCRELGEWLPDHLILDKRKPCSVLIFRKFWYKESPQNPKERLVWCIYYDYEIKFRSIADTEPNARAKMLIWLVENGYINFKGGKDEKREVN